MNHHDAGDRVQLTGTFTTLAGAPVNPTAVVARVRNPDGVVTTPTASSSVVGTWTANVDVNVVGVWTYRFEGTGAVVAAEETMFKVDPTSFP